MYHSHLLINVGDNPDRPDWNITRKWLRNLYRVHQRLCMAFPSRVPATAADRLAAYCAPYGGGGAHERDLPGEPDSADVHHARSDEAGFLFRIDHPVYDVADGKATRIGQPRCRPVIIVQSVTRPDWDFAFGLDAGAVDDRDRPVGNASFLLSAPPQCRAVSFSLDGETLAVMRPDRPDLNFQVQPGHSVRFRLRANPVVTIDGKRHRPRVAKEDFDAGGERRETAFLQAHEDWLRRKLGSAADGLEATTLVTGWASGWRTKHEPQPNQKMQWWSVLFEGTFRVKDPATLKMHLDAGIGPAKAFGFGLLSIAPVR